MGWEVTPSHCQWCGPGVLQVQVTHILASAIEGGFGRRRMGLCTGTHCQWHPSPSSGLQAARGRRAGGPWLGTPSQAGRRLDSESEVAWTSLPVSIGLNSSGRSRSNLTESSSRSWPATIEAVQPEGRGSSLRVWVDGWAAAVRQSVWGPGRNSAGSRHSVRSHLARVSVDTADLVSSGPGGREVANNNFLKRHKTSHSFLRMSFLARSATAPFGNTFRYYTP